MRAPAAPAPCAMHLDAPDTPPRPAGGPVADCLADFRRAADPVRDRFDLA